MKWRGLDIATNFDVYPPKPASLLLANIAIKTIKPKQRVLDMCTGCGIVAIAVAKFVPNAKVFASDINPQAISLTKLNAKRNKVEVTATVGNFCKPFRGNQFDVITVHPPAVPYPKKMDWGLSKGMRTATNGGADGSRLIIRSILEAKRCLKGGGKLLLLLPHWSSIKKAHKLLSKNYSKVSELAKKKVLFFPIKEGKPNKQILQYFYKLAKKKVIEVELKGNIPYSFVSVIQATK